MHPLVSTLCPFPLHIQIQSQLAQMAWHVQSVPGLCPLVQHASHKSVCIVSTPRELEKLSLVAVRVLQLGVQSSKTGMSINSIFDQETSRRVLDADQQRRLHKGPPDLPQIPGS